MNRSRVTATTLPRILSCLSLNRLATVAIIQALPAHRVQTIGAFWPRQLLWSGPLATAAVNFISMQLVECCANRWVIDAPSLGHYPEPRSSVETRGRICLRGCFGNWKGPSAYAPQRARLWMSLAMKPTRRRGAGNVRPVAMRRRAPGDE